MALVSFYSPSEDFADWAIYPTECEQVGVIDAEELNFGARELFDYACVRTEAIDRLEEISNKLDEAVPPRVQDRYSLEASHLVIGSEEYSGGMEQAAQALDGAAMMYVSEDDLSCSPYKLGIEEILDEESLRKPLSDYSSSV